MVKTPIKKSVQKIRDEPKQRELVFVEPLEELSTKKERERFKRYRLPVSKYIARLPKSKQYAIRTSPKKQKPVSPKKPTSPKKAKKIDYSQLIDNMTDDIIAKIYEITDLAKSTKSTTNKTAKFFDDIKDEISSFKSQIM